MIASNVGSTNTDDVHIRIPKETTSSVNGRSLLRRFRDFITFNKSQNPEGEGYVEFSSLRTENGRTLGTFAGVFSPVTLSMFSSLVFIRMGYIVGNAGLLVTLIQFVIAYGILIFTVASVCAISTNGAVEGGGAYFMISRTLGPEFGGSIGTLFFMANIVSSALCISGCAEGIVDNFGPGGYLAGAAGFIHNTRWWKYLYRSILNLMNLMICLIGATMFAKTSVVILATVLICLNNYTGLYTGLSLETLRSSGAKFMAGANMSGELKNPGVNIPRGTLSAVFFTFICYTFLAVLTAATTSQFLLQNNFLYMIPINVWSPFVIVGILTATFSASLSNLIGSSRVIEALAKDNIFGSILNFVVNGTWRGNPIAAVFTSWTLVQLILLIESLNSIAQINSVLFLLSYLATNLSCLGLELASAPNFRPTFNYFSWHTATIGLVGTVIMMFTINSIYASLSIIVCLLLIMILHFVSPSKNAAWGSISQALLFHQVRKYLLMLDSRKDHVKHWRLSILHLINSPRGVCPLIDFVNDLKKGGLYVIGHVKVGDFTEESVDPTIEEYPQWLNFIDHMKIKAFIEMTVTKTVREGLAHLIRISGIGAMKPNTIVLGFYDNEAPVDFFKDSKYSTTIFNSHGLDGSTTIFPLRSVRTEKIIDAAEYVGMCSDVLKMKKNLCLCRNFHLLDKSQIKNSNFEFIDVWPVNFFKPSNQDAFDTTSLFMLQLACIINMVPDWKDLKLRVFYVEIEENVSNLSISDHEQTSCEFPKASTESRIQKLLKMLRISAHIQKISNWESRKNSRQGNSSIEDSGVNLFKNSGDRQYMQNVNQVIREKSDKTAAVFCYLPAPPIVNSWDEDSENLRHEYLELLTDMTVDLPPTVLVHGVSAVTSTSI
ncbi:solute carrier family 12 member 9 [Aphidius gifuensis]|uniref:solute carrier family 12 member 9 n=1 Tax=Aphidius gifuensis TaxID=684658 RepID=UPI001CDC7810|nr:solute carrier family 12 member 9 [Aphidius gifuensis]